MKIKTLNLLLVLAASLLCLSAKAGYETVGYDQYGNPILQMPTLTVTAPKPKPPPPPPPPPPMPPIPPPSIPTMDDGFGGGGGGYIAGSGAATTTTTNSSTAIKTETYNGVKLTGTQADIDKAKAWLDSIKNFSDKRVANEFDRLTKEAAANGKPLTINLTSNSATVTVGNWQTATIDISDILKFPTSTGSGATQLATFAHEIFEQLYTQIEGKPFSEAHSAAIIMEDIIANMTRVSEVATVVPNADGTTSVTTRFISPDGAVVIGQTITRDAAGNVIKITSSVIPKP